MNDNQSICSVYPLIIDLTNKLIHTPTINLLQLLKGDSIKLEFCLSFAKRFGSVHDKKYDLAVTAFCATTQYLLTIAGDLKNSHWQRYIKYKQRTDFEKQKSR